MMAMTVRAGQGGVRARVAASQGSRHSQPHTASRCRPMSAVTILRPGGLERIERRMRTMMAWFRMPNRANTTRQSWFSPIAALHSTFSCGYIAEERF